MRFSCVFLLFSLSSQAACPAWPLVIAHRGASGDYPEHSEIAYWQAMLQGADFIEADLVPTKDGVLISRHENELSQSTNIAELPQFAERKTRKKVDGVMVEGWFSEDFTLAELRQIKLRESKPLIRPANRLYNDQYGILTLAEVMQLVQRFEQQHGRKVGLYLETKHPTFFLAEGRLLDGHQINRNISEQLLQQLSVWQQTQHNPVYIQSFEISNLWWMRQQGLQKYQVNAKLVQLIGDISGTALYPKSNFAEPWDLVSRPASTQALLHQQQDFIGKAGFHYGALITPAGLTFLSQYVDGIGPWKEQWFAKDKTPASPQQLKSYGLQLHPYTFRAETEFLPTTFATLKDELQQRYQQGVDGVFTDFTAIAVKTRTETCALKSKANHLPD
ncbi:glycerophosphodiester phosphodiesterase family protein [Rheinheimera sp.]|uniref:glycerophosphodiester phosphodiesterase family protein n=1 Tax=Rheinheimera sp. TaxID=1869214 RepID=UPI003D2D7316